MFFDTFLKKINKKGFSKSLWYYCCLFLTKTVQVVLCDGSGATAVVRRQWCDISCFAIKSFKHFSKNNIN